MRVAYLTAGAGGMYCGSCLRDNALAGALRRRGHDVLLMPVYSPIRTDETDVSENGVLYGGINVYLQYRWPWISKLPNAVTKLLDRPALLRLAMRGAGSTDPKLAANLMLALLEGESGPQKVELDKLTDYLQRVDASLVHLPNAFFVGLASAIKRRVNIPVVCTLTGEDILLDTLDDAHRNRVLDLLRTKARDVDGFIGVTKYYGSYAREHFEVDADRLRHIPLGISIEPNQPKAMTPQEKPFTIGYLARICPEKGLHNLVDAFEILLAEGRDCRLKIAGYLGKGDQAYFQKLRVRIESGSLAGRVDYLGEVDRAGKFKFLQEIDVFSVPTDYAEAKGLYILEALSQGVPVVQPEHGSFPELVEASGGGLLHRPGDALELAARLAELMDDPDKRRHLGRTGREAVHAEFTDERMAERVWDYFTEIHAQHTGRPTDQSRKTVTT